MIWESLQVQLSAAQSGAFRTSDVGKDISQIHLHLIPFTNFAIGRVSCFGKVKK
jgi:hypothetical protein